MNDLNQALENLIKYTKPFGNHKVTSKNTGIAMIDKIGEVVYTRVIPDVRNNGMEELVLFNDGNSEVCGEFATFEPFTSALTDKYYDFIFEFNENTYTVTSIRKFKALDKQLAKLSLLGVL